MSDRRETQANLRQQIIGILYEPSGTSEYTLAQQADEILALVKGNEPPGGWFHFGSHVDWAGDLEFSEEVGEDGLPRWERPLPLTEHETVENWTPAGRGWREMQEGESAGGREFVTHGWLARPIDSFHQIRSWVQDEDRPTEWSKEMEEAGYPSFGSHSASD